jgi:hypothetical protein
MQSFKDGDFYVAIGPLRFSATLPIDLSRSSWKESGYAHRQEVFTGFRK